MLAVLTYNKDIYKRILEPADVKYFIGNEIQYYKKPTNRKMVWEFLFPKQIRERISLNDSSFSALNQGKSDKKNSTDAARERFKQVLVYSNSEYHDYMANHLVKMIDTNAKIAVWLDKHNKAFKLVDLKEKELNECMEEFPADITKSKDNILKRISSCLKLVKNELFSDIRISEEFWERIIENINDNPLLVVEFLCILSIFYEDDTDYAFYEMLEEHYLKIVNRNKNKSRANESDVSCLCDTNASKEDVFKLLEDERKRLDDVIVEKTKTDYRVSKSVVAVEQCEKYMAQLKNVINQLENEESSKRR